MSLKLLSVLLILTWINGSYAETGLNALSDFVLKAVNSTVFDPSKSICDPTLWAKPELPLGINKLVVTDEFFNHTLTLTYDEFGCRHDEIRRHGDTQLIDGHFSNLTFVSAYEVPELKLAMTNVTLTSRDNNGNIFFLLELGNVQLVTSIIEQSVIHFTGNPCTFDQEITLKCEPINVSSSEIHSDVLNHLINHNKNLILEKLAHKSSAGQKAIDAKGDTCFLSTTYVVDKS